MVSRLLYMPLCQGWPAPVGAASNAARDAPAGVALHELARLAGPGTLRPCVPRAASAVNGSRRGGS